MAKEAKKAKKSVTKKQVKRTKLRLVNKTFDAMFDNKPEVQSIGIKVDGSIEEYYARTPSNDEIKKSFLYQDLLHKYQRVALKLHNKREQLKSSKKRLFNGDIRSRFKLTESELDKIDLENQLELALMIANRARSKTGQELITVAKLKEYYSNR